MSRNGLGTTRDSIVKCWVNNRTLLVPWGNPLPNAIWCLLQVSRELSKWTNLQGILGRSGTTWEKVEKQSFGSPLRGDYKKGWRENGKGVGKHKEGSEIMREEKGERSNQKGGGLGL